jgi:hypothetical protein|tara:strand:+ start:623 stop:823 length:201 start_codon:yes stop_codon:yes gene_type:complete
MLIIYIKNGEKRGKGKREKEREREAVFSFKRNISKIVFERKGERKREKEVERGGNTVHPEIFERLV